MPRRVSPVPKGFHTVTPALIVHDGAAALAWYGKALGATERNRALGPGGKVWHAEILVGNSVVMVTDEFPEMGARSPNSLGSSTAGLWLYVPDVDAWYERAVREGARPAMPPADMFWGDRFGRVIDPFGHSWTFATRKEIVSPRERERRRLVALARGPSPATGAAGSPGGAGAASTAPEGSAEPGR
jgi:PhnB protein